MNSNTTDSVELPQCGHIVGKTHFLPVRVYFSDTDSGGVVYHGRYLDMAEHARTEMLRCVGLDHRQLIEETGNCFVVKRVEVEYHRPARLDWVVTVESEVVKLGRASLELRQRVCTGTTPLVEIQVRMGFVDLETGRPTQIPPSWREVMGAFL